MQDELVWDDELWERVWERTLDPVERHHLALAVWRRRMPDDPFEAVIAPELARRWRRHACTLAVVYGLWTLFWGLLALDDFRANSGFSALLSPACAAVGLTAIGLCMAFRRRLRCFARRSRV